MSPELILEKGVLQLGLSVTPEVQRKLLSYLELLKKWNRVYSLTAILQPEQMVSHHLLDSLAVVPYLWPGSWLDVGSGAGLPGVVMALMHPEWEFTLLDSNSKKTSFMQQVVIELGLSNVVVCCTRVESWRPEKKFNGIISRAFAQVGEFTALTQHLLTQNGGWIAMKGAPDQELKQLPIGVVLEKVIPLQVPSLNAARCLVLLKAV